MAARIDVYEDAAGGFRWTLVAGNGEIVAQGESHTQRSDAERAARTAAELMGQAVEDSDWPDTPDAEGQG